MKAAVFHGLGQALTIEDQPEPKPGPGEIVLRVKSCGICGSDLHAAELPPGLPPGTVMGHEFAGEVIEVGADAKALWKPGELSPEKARAQFFEVVFHGLTGDRK